MRILFYNWVDYLDDEKRGGGVTVYQRNLMDALASRDDVDAVFLSSGISYDLFSDRPRWEKVRHGPAQDRCRRFEIVNSGVLSPAHHSFGNAAQVDHPQTAEVFFDFLEKRGPFDVIHFNNIEGLPATVLRLKERFPRARLVFSLHNYYPLCPQVNLWSHERENCRDFDRGQRCETCVDRRYDERIVRVANAVAFNLKKWGIRPGTRIFDRAFQPGMRFGSRAVAAFSRLRRKLRPAVGPMPTSAAKRGLLTPLTPDNLNFTGRRARFVGLINENCDVVLGVSSRVCDVATHFGIHPDLLRTSYIGTAQASKWGETEPKPTLLGDDNTLTMAYLGYMRQDKGFFFLLDALEAMPVTMASRIRLVICARRRDDQTMRRLSKLSGKFLAVYYADGYSHSELDELLEGVDLGVVPVMWEDNLPQVAIEMHSRHIPLLTSDLGGARELSRCPDMVFHAGSTASFIDRISRILGGDIAIDEYWRDALAPVSMEQHVAELMAIYRGDEAKMPARHVPRPILQEASEHIITLHPRVNTTVRVPDHQIGVPPSA